MAKQDTDRTSHAQRDQTDESLRVERGKADSRVAEKRDAVEEQADEVVRVARARADQVVQTARDEADRERGPMTIRTESRSELERTRADAELQLERSSADAVLERERAARGSYLADFLAVEREATDQDLVGERAHADTAIAARDEFLATVSHDLRNLLAGLSLNSGLISKLAQDGADGDKIRRHAASNQRMVVRMSRLIGDLLDVTSIEAGKLAVHLEEVDVAELLRETLDAFGPIAAAKQIALAADAPMGPLRAQGDAGRIMQVLVNLVSNAIKFTEPGGSVSIAGRAAGHELEVAVRDTGIGIAEAALPGVFDRFRQISKDRRGLGLGLHISKCIVEAHGGRLWADSQPGVGSTFSFTLPVGGA